MPRQRQQKITPRALMELKMPGEVQIAPDGVRIAYSVSETDWDDNRITQHLYVTTTHEDAVPRQVTRGLAGESAPLWSPDGKWLAFLSSREDEDADDDEFDDAEAKQQVYVLPMDGMGGEAEKLTSASEGVEAYDWLRDSSGVAYLAREPRPKPLQAARDDKIERKDDAVVEREEKFRVQIWRIDREDKKAVLLHPGDYGIGEIAASPDGQRIAYTTNYTGEANDYHHADVWLLTIDSREAKQLTEGPGGKYHPVWTPDSASVLFNRTLDPSLSYSQENLYSVPSHGGAVTHITEDFPHDLTGWHGVWFDDQARLYVSAALGTTTAIFRHAQNGFEPIIQSDQHIHDFHISALGGIAFVASGAQDVPELLWLAPDAREPEVITALNEDWAAKYAVAPTDLVRWRSDDGLEIDGLLTYPPGLADDQHCPLILQLHGGPHGRALQALSPFTSAQVYAADGYAVLAPNYRGSEGYGNDFGVANKEDLGGGDYRDVMSGIDWAIRDGIADPERLAVTGASYGGFLTNWIIGHTDRFKAAVSEFGIFSLVTDFSQSQAPRWETEYLGGYPWDQPETYAAQSPASYVAQINTPVLLLHGEGDGNTVLSNSQEMYQALRFLGKTVEYAHYPREGHGFFEPEHRIDEYRRILRWLDRFVLGAGKPHLRIGDKSVQDGWELTVAHALLESYAGRGNDKARYVEVAFILRDVSDARQSLTVTPSDVSLTRTGAKRRLRPVGMPIDVLGQKVLAEGGGWKFAFRPAAGEKANNERGLAVPLAVAFRISDMGGEYRFQFRDFPAVTMDVPAADKDEKKDLPGKE